MFLRRKAPHRKIISEFSLDFKGLWGKKIVKIFNREIHRENYRTKIKHKLSCSKCPEQVPLDIVST